MDQELFDEYGYPDYANARGLPHEEDTNIDHSPDYPDHVEQDDDDHDDGEGDGDRAPGHPSEPENEIDPTKDDHNERTGR